MHEEVARLACGNDARPSLRSRLASTTDRRGLRCKMPIPVKCSPGRSVCPTPTDIPVRPRPRQEWKLVDAKQAIARLRLQNDETGG